MYQNFNVNLRYCDFEASKMFKAITCYCSFKKSICFLYHNLFRWLALNVSMHLRSRAKYSLLISIHQLQAALLDIHEIFFEIPVHERMALIAHSRQLMVEKRLRDSVRAYKKVLNVKFNLIDLAQGHKTLTSLLLIWVSLF